MKGFIGGIPLVLLAEVHGVYPQSGSTLIGGPSGNDGDGGFVSPYYANVKTNTQVNEWNKDDHSIHLKHKDVYHRPPMVPVAFGSSVASGPHVPRMGPSEKRGAPGITLMGGPSGNDGGETYSNPTTVDVSTAVYEHNEDDHSIDLVHEDSYPGPPFPGFSRSRRSVGPEEPPFADPPAEHNEAHSEAHYQPHPEPHFVDHPEPHFVDHPEPHFVDHPEPHFVDHPEPHFVDHPEPHFVDHPEPHYDSHYSPSYEPHYEPHTELDTELTTIKNVNNAPAAGAISFGRH
ncbi:hypothetical protein N7526_001795 [Penicillium atrosanguineum]|nr:hypothetical protein N7526_001795 [Penicillium atrosanguineum]